MLNWIVVIFGAIVGSFLNVCIVRLPKEQSIVKPRSHCPHCQKPIPAYLNIPVLSWFMLLGRCRFCKAKISFEYPFIEACSALLAYWLFRRLGLTWNTLLHFIFCASLLVIAMIDIHDRIIPNVISLPGIVYGLICSFFLPQISFVDSLIGILAGGGVLLAIATFYRVVRKIEGMGMGDVKLLAMIGAFLGWRPLLFILLVSSATGAVIGVAFILAMGKNLRYQIPFGTFLSFATILQILYGEEMVHFWESLFRLRM